MQRLYLLHIGNLLHLASTSGATAPSTSTKAMALPPADSRPRWKVAMLMPAPAEQRREAADKAGPVLVGHVEHRRTELRIHADALDVDDARAAVRIDRARDPARLPVGDDSDGDQALVVAFGFAPRLLDDDAAILGDDRRRDDVNVLQHRAKEACNRGRSERPGVHLGDDAFVG